MKIKISEIAYYGRFYSNLTEHVIWWFCTLDFQICDTETIISVYGFSSIEEILDSSKFIPLFKTDIIELEKKFLKEKNIALEKIGSEIQRIQDFDKCFKIFIEAAYLTQHWHMFEKQHLFSDAIVWCKNNAIPFVKEM